MVTAAVFTICPDINRTEGGQLLSRLLKQQVDHDRQRLTAPVDHLTTNGRACRGLSLSFAEAGGASGQINPP